VRLAPVATQVTESGVPHWLLPLFAGSFLIGVIAFAFRQGTKVRSDRSNNDDNWSYTGGGGAGGSHGGCGGSDGACGGYH
jgi:hypothetical protein